MAIASLAPDLDIVAALALAELAPLEQLSPADLLVALPDVIPAMVDRWGLAAAAVAADWYDSLREAADVAGRFWAIIDPVDLGADELIGWAIEPLRAATPDATQALFRAAGGLDKRLVNAANQVVTKSSEVDPQARGWVRTTRANGCDFCRTIAGRGVVYAKGTVRFACHDRCKCSASPSWKNQPVAVDKYRPSDLPPEQRAAMNRAARQWIRDNLT